MRTLTKVVVVAMFVGLVFTASGCCAFKKGGCGRRRGECKTLAAQTLCKGCGQVKGSDECCKAGAVKCTECGLDKGSPGCCK